MTKINRKLSSKGIPYKYILWVLFLLPLFYLRDWTPDNELRYIAIADEALQHGHLFAFYNDGLPYADKPPLYLWIVMICRFLFGSHCSVFLGLFSILPALVVLYVMDCWTREEMEKPLRIVAQLMLLSTAYFIGSMCVLRMDMLMCMFIVLSLYLFFLMYKGPDKKSYHILFPLCVFFAVFTKGPYGFMIPVVSIMVYLIVCRKSKLIVRYLDVRFWLILLGLCMIWFLCVYIEGGKSYLYDLLFHQTINRAVDSFTHKKGFFFYFQNLWFTMSPWSLIYIGIIAAAMIKKKVKSDMEIFFLTIILTTLLMLSCVSSKLDIYLLPIYPFVSYLTLLFLKSYRNKIGSKILLSVLYGIMSVITIIVLIGLCVNPQWKTFQSASLYMVVVLLSIFGLYALFLLWRKNNSIGSIKIASIGLLCSVFVSSFYVPRINKYIGYGELAHQAQVIGKSIPRCRYFSYAVPRASGMKVYLNQDVVNLERKDLKLQVENGGSFILFVRNKKVKGDKYVQSILFNHPQILVGDYMLVVYK